MTSERVEKQICRILKILAWTGLLGAEVLCAARPEDALERGFRDPPHAAKPHTWYHVMNGNATKSGITKDFEALAEIGIGGVQMFDAGCDMPAGPVKFNSTEWFELIRHAAVEAKRLGLEICLPNCSGWSSSGGPWVKPEDGMKEIVWAEGGKRPDVLPSHPFYRDIAVIAFKAPAAERTVFRGESTSRGWGEAEYSSADLVTAAGLLYRFEMSDTYGLYGHFEVEISNDGVTWSKAGEYKANACVNCVRNFKEQVIVFEKPLEFRKVRVKYIFEKGMKSDMLAVRDLRPTAMVRLSNLDAKRFDYRYEVSRDDFVTTPEQVVDPAVVIDISDHLRSDGTIDWTPPENGSWKVYRVGYRGNGRKNHPASAHGVGLEVDKLSAAALSRHFKAYVQRLCDYLGPDLVGHGEYGLNNILVDSYEVGSQTWTDGFEKIFKERAGYDIIPYLPVFFGYIVGSVARSEDFLADYRRVIAALFAENYGDALARECHKLGLMLSLEPYGNCPADNLRYGRNADIPMCEFWSSAGNPYQNQCRNAKLASSLAHVHGRSIVGAEAFTASGSRPGGGNKGPGSGGWMTLPFHLKAQGDAAFASGVNRIIYHRFVHQPWTDVPRLPGMTMGKWGMHFDRTQTWWSEGKEWIAYQTRCQFLLQAGRDVSDLLWYCGDDVPNLGGDVSDSQNGCPKPPPGYNVDYISKDGLADLVERDGRFVAPSGAQYALVFRTGEEKSLPGKLTAKGVRPDCLIVPERIERGLNPVWCHRRDAAIGADWYFIAANNRGSMEFKVSLRDGKGRIPELWDPENRTILRARDWREVDGRTEVVLNLPVCGSMFVMFRNRAVAESVPLEKRYNVVQEIPMDGSWMVEFPNAFRPNALAKGAPEQVHFDRLVDWAKHDEKRIRGFSGSALYRRRINLTDAVSLDRLVLDLGDVRDFATVTVNGHVYPALWKPPFRVDVSDAVKGSVLDVSIRVTNRWPNKLIDDDRKPDDCTWKKSAVHGDAIEEIPEWVEKGLPSPTGRDTFVTWRHWRGTDQPLSSGLLGPVKLVREREKGVLP